ncbi:hypothetical protein MBEBAB_0996 [Brevundimonas abyssalis TAR-001]|uniref:Uncharacterized protein n=1 Tax=Brevundimonas abyssalis TAR-001 TaxID=1391729 RepID=A0A8E0KIC8_9CAUL|nr:hypothetical protein MBEBAB_0996 [Brevundimonas abyssalis TAR-001]
MLGQRNAGAHQQRAVRTPGHLKVHRHEPRIAEGRGVRRRGLGSLRGHGRFPASLWSAYATKLTQGRGGATICRAGAGGYPHPITCVSRPSSPMVLARRVRARGAAPCQSINCRRSNRR